MKPPSALKHRVAQMIREEFMRQGIPCTLFAGDFRTADGFWRRVDVYRWQIYVNILTNERWTNVEVSCWDTLTECSHYGIEIDYRLRGGIGRSWEACALRQSKETNTNTKQRSEPR